MNGDINNCYFAWVEPNLAAGHIVFQLKNSDFSFRNLYPIDQKGGYKFREINNPELENLREPGCQSFYTPYSGLQILEFAILCTKIIIEW